MDESNLLSCRKQYKVLQSYSEYHMRFQILTKQIPMEVVLKHADSIQEIRDAHSKGTKDAEKISGLVDGFPNMTNLQELLVTVKQCGSSKMAHSGRTEQAHTLKKKMDTYDWNKSFTEGNSFLFFPYFYFFIVFINYNPAQVPIRCQLLTLLITK